MATPAIKAALRSFDRGEGVRAVDGRQAARRAEHRDLREDDLPQPSAVDLTSYLPFLKLG